MTSVGVVINWHLESSTEISVSLLWHLSSRTPHEVLPTLSCTLTIIPRSRNNSLKEIKNKVVSWDFQNGFAELPQGLDG